MGLVLGSNLTYYNINTFAQKVFDVGGRGVSDRTPVIQWDSNGQTNQQFFVDPCGADVYRIIARHSGRVLDLSGPNGAGSPIWQFAWAAADNQRWRIKPAQEGLVEIESVYDPDLVLDVAEASSDSGALIIAWNRTGQANQLFRLTPLLPS